MISQFIHLIFHFLKLIFILYFLILLNHNQNDYFILELLFDEILFINLLLIIDHNLYPLYHLNLLKIFM